MDADKLLLLRFIQRDKRGDRIIVTDTQVGDYRDVDGYPVAFEFTSYRDGKIFFKEKYDNVKVNAPIPAEVFDPSRWSSHRRHLTPPFTTPNEISIDRSDCSRRVDVCRRSGVCAARDDVRGFCCGKKRFRSAGLSVRRVRFFIRCVRPTLRRTVAARYIHHSFFWRNAETVSLGDSQSDRSAMVTGRKMGGVHFGRSVVGSCGRRIESAKAHRLNGGVSGPVWSPTGDKIAVVSGVYPGLRRQSVQCRATGEGRFEPGEGARHRQSHVPSLECVGAEYARASLRCSRERWRSGDVTPGVKYDVPPGRSGKRRLRVFSDGRELAYTAKDQGREDAWSTDINLYTVPVDRWRFDSHHEGSAAART